MPNNGLGANTNVLRNIGVTYNPTNTFTLSSLNSSYLIAVRLKIISTAVNTGLYTLKVSINAGDSSSAHNTYIKGGSYENDITNVFIIPASTLVSGVPIPIILRPDVACSAYNMGYTIQRLYFEN
jgi:hypothetical protein